MTRIPNTPSWHDRLGLKEPGTGRDFRIAVSEYLDNFSYQQELKLGPSYGMDFKEFHDWCETNLGTKFKDWFLFSSGKHTYTLYCRNDKWAIFLKLTHVDKLA